MRQSTAHLLITQHLAMIAHLDAIEARITARFDRIDDQIAGIRLELATHDHHGQEPS